MLGRRYAQAGADQGEAVLRDLAAHPATAQFIVTKLARHFAADDPPASLVERLRTCFLETGGDLRALARTLVTSPEPWQEDAGKFQPPEDYVVSVQRALGGPPMTGIQWVALLGEMGQRPWWPPGPDGWKDVASEWLAPDALWKRIEWAAVVGQVLAQSQRGSVQPLAIAGQVLGAALSDGTRAALQRAESPAQALALLVSAPEFMRR